MGYGVEQVIETPGPCCLSSVLPFKSSFFWGEMRSTEGLLPLNMQVGPLASELLDIGVCDVYKRANDCCEQSRRRDCVFFLNACLSLLIRSAHIGKLTMKY